MLTAFLRHPICKKRLSDLSATDFVKWKDERIKGKGSVKPITAKSAKRLLSPVQRLLQVAMDEWDVPLRENPLSRFKLKVIDNKQQRRLREGELDRLLEAGKKTRQAAQIQRKRRVWNSRFCLSIQDFSENFG